MIAARLEQARSVADVLLRRTRLGLLAAPQLRDAESVRPGRRGDGGASSAGTSGRIAAEAEAWVDDAAAEGIDPAPRTRVERERSSTPGASPRSSEIAARRRLGGGRLRRRLAVTAFEHQRLHRRIAAGDPLIEEHDEHSPGAGGHEELYLVVTGRAASHESTATDGRGARRRA